jgi:hypothetical protein
MGRGRHPNIIVRTTSFSTFVSPPSFAFKANLPRNLPTPAMGFRHRYSPIATPKKGYQAGGHPQAMRESLTNPSDNDSTAHGRGKSASFNSFGTPSRIR